MRGYGLGVILFFVNFKLFTGLRGTIQSQHLYRYRRPDFFDALTAEVKHGLDFTIILTADNNISLSERSRLNKYGRLVPPALVQRSFDHRPCSRTIGVGFQF